MTFKEILKLPKYNFTRYKKAFIAALLLIAVATVYPTDIANDYPVAKNAQGMAVAEVLENYGRHTNSILPLATIIILRDWAGLKQLVVLTGVGIIATHGPKRALNNVEIMGTRLGHRPYAPDSRHNMPSGHSSLASAGAYFMMRRYSLWFGLIVIPVMLLTMYTRVMLDMHTISATISGALTGIVVTALFTTRMQGVRARFKRLFLRS